MIFVVFQSARQIQRVAREKGAKADHRRAECDPHGGRTETIALELSIAQRRADLVTRRREREQWPFAF